MSTATALFASAKTRRGREEGARERERERGENRREEPEKEDWRRREEQEEGMATRAGEAIRKDGRKRIRNRIGQCGYRWKAYEVRKLSER